MARPQAAPSLSSTEMLARLVAFDTTSRHSNLALIGFMRSWLDTHGVSYRLSFDPTGQKANLHATIGPVQPGGLAFSGHLDTVSADGQSWTGDPFTLRRQDGRLVGRGACDMKGFVAAALAAVPDIKARKPSRPVHLLFTYDEEVGYHGARRLIADLQESRLHPAACVVGEASGMQPILAQKGRLIARVAVRGHAAHSSEAHRGVNAAHAAAEAIAYLAAASRRHALHGPMEAGFDPPYTTLQVNNLTCEGLPNTLPDRTGSMWNGAISPLTTRCRSLPVSRRMWRPRSNRRCARCGPAPASNTRCCWTWRHSRCRRTTIWHVRPARSPARRSAAR